MVTFKIDMQSEATKTLGRLVNFDVTEVHKDIAPEAKIQAQKGYAANFGGMKESTAKNVYTALKRALLGHAQRGRLTDSTSRAISSKYSQAGVEAGIFAHMWPTQYGHETASMDYVMEFLEKVWSGTGEGYNRRATRESNRALRESWLPYVTGNVTMKWGADGFHIIWPKEAHKRLKLHDYFIPREPFETKRYKKGRKGVGDFFYIDSKFIGSVMDIVGHHVNKALGLERKTRKSDMELAGKDLIRSDIREYLDEVGKSVWWDPPSGRE